VKLGDVIGKRESAMFGRFDHFQREAHHAFDFVRHAERVKFFMALVKFRETVDPKSPPIVLLSPSGSPEPFYAEFGWTNAAGATLAVPTADTVWTQSGSGPLAVDKPVTLTYSPASAFQVSGITNDFSGANNYRPNVTCDPTSASPSITAWFNASCVSIPTDPSFARPWEPVPRAAGKSAALWASAGLAKAAARIPVVRLRRLRRAASSTTPKRNNK